MVTERIEVRLDPDHRHKLAELVSVRQSSVSGLVREWIDEAYDEQLRSKRKGLADRIAAHEIEEVPDPKTLKRQIDALYDVDLP